MTATAASSPRGVETAVGWAAVVACAVTGGCRKAEPTAAGPVDPPAVRSAAAGPAACPVEVRLWLIWHGFGPDAALADVCDQLDGLDDAHLRAFDRNSPSRVGYRDVRPGLLRVVSARGDRVTVRDLALVRDECLGRWRDPDPPDRLEATETGTP